MDQQQFLDALCGLMAIESVAMTDPTLEMPYGSGPAKALDYVLDLCGKLGIRTVNRDGKTAWAEIGAGEEIVGILGHLDVVPVGEGWSHDPKGEVCGDRLYGRGAIDDKGPTLAALFAMKDVQDAGVPLKRRIRLIFGQSEETSRWDDMEWYKAHEELPVFGFTPDADFPALCGEKGILNFELSIPLAESGLLSIQGGEAMNMVPAQCTAAFPESDGPTAIVTTGASAHASTPEKGENAISAMMDALIRRDVQSPLVDFYQAHIGYDLHGERLGCAFSDEESGQLTVNVGLARTEEARIVLSLDIRNPVTFTRQQVQSALETACAPYGITVECVKDMPPVYMDKNGKVIQAMMAVYRSVTGDDSPPKVIGGGTYARAMPGIVAFGPMRPGRECTEHEKDEYILLDDLFQAQEIYRRTIEVLANLD